MVDVFRFKVIREPDDPLADTRISLGSIDGHAYIVFRGNPHDVIELLEGASVVAAKMLPEGNYEDRR